MKNTTNWLLVVYVIVVSMNALFASYIVYLMYHNDYRVVVTEEYTNKKNDYPESWNDTIICDASMKEGTTIMEIFYNDGSVYELRCGNVTTTNDPWGRR